MATEETAILAEREQVLGLEAGRYYHHLWHQLVLMHATLHELRVLLMIRRGEVNVPTSLRNRLFNMLWGAYGRDLIHGISALADPAITKPRFHNVSLEGLMAKVAKVNVVSCEWKAALVAFREAAAPIEAYRNKRLAHHDAEMILNGTVTDVNATVDQIELALDKASEVLNTVEREYFQNAAVLYKDTWVAPGGIETLIHILSKNS